MLLFALLFGPLARGESSDGVVGVRVRVRVLNDVSGVFQDYNGPGSVAAARVAAEDFMAANPAIRVEIVQGDHQNRPDVGSFIVRRWLDLDRVDAVVDGPSADRPVIVRGTRKRTCTLEGLPQSGAPRSR